MNLRKQISFVLMEKVLLMLEDGLGERKQKSANPYSPDLRIEKRRSD